MIIPNWCADCGQRPVPHHGDACPGCIGRLEAHLAPITHDTPPKAAPPLLRFLRWAGKRKETTA